MNNCFLKLGTINSKLIVQLILFILSISHIFYINYVLENKANVLITEISSSIGHILIIIIPYIKCISTRKGKKSKTLRIKNKKYYIKDYSIFLSTHLINLILLYVCSQLKPSSKTKDDNIFFLSSEIHGLYCIESIEIIFIIIASFCLLNYHYYIHHYLTLILFIILSIAIDYMLGHFTSKIDILYMMAFIGQILVESFNLSYQKYMFDVLYYSPYRTCFAFGILFLIYNIITIVFFLLFQKYEFLEYFNDKSIIHEIIKVISNIIMVFLLYISMALTNFHFSPSHVVISSELANMAIFLFISKKNNIEYYKIVLSMILFFFQFILLMIFLEIIELNFCGLNKNTKENIRIRSDNDLLDDIQHCDSNKIEVFSQYIFEANNSETPEEEEENS